MPIRPFLDGEVFEQVLIDTMSRALADACRELGLTDKIDGAVRLLALRIIEQAKHGVHDPARLKAAALQGLGSQRRH